jgi:hypothetical protein
VAARVHLWATLQELAGLVTPFTDQVHAEAEAAVAGSRARELAELQAQHEQQLAELQQRFNEDAVHRIRRQLLALAGSRAPDRAPEGNGEA